MASVICVFGILWHLCIVNVVNMVLDFLVEMFNKVIMNAKRLNWGSIIVSGVVSKQAHKMAQKARRRDGDGETAPGRDGRHGRRFGKRRRWRHWRRWRWLHRRQAEKNGIKKESASFVVYIYKRYANGKKGKTKIAASSCSLTLYKYHPLMYYVLSLSIIIIWKNCACASLSSIFLLSPRFPSLRFVHVVRTQIRSNMYVTV